MRCSRNARSAWRRLITRGTPSASSTFRLSERRTSSSVWRNSCSISSSAGTVRARGTSTRRTSSADSSRTSASSGSLRSAKKLGDALDQPRLGDLVGNFADHHLVLAVAQLLTLPAGAQAQAAAAGPVSLDDAVPGLDQHPAGRQVRPPDVREQGLARSVRLVEQMAERLAQLARVVGRDAGRHADRDAAGAVGEQIGERRRQHHRLLVAAVVGRPEVDRVLLDAVEQRAGDLGQARLGVAHRGGVIAVDIAEIALAVDQRVTLGELLRQTHHGIVDRGLAMGVVLADHVADDAGAFLVAAVGIEPQLEHRVEHAPLDRLEAVAHVGQRARGDGRERVGEIAAAQRVGEGDRLDRGGRGRARHGPSRWTGGRPGKLAQQPLAGIWHGALASIEQVAAQEGSGQAQAGLDLGGIGRFLGRAGSRAAAAGERHRRRPPRG